MNSPFFWRNVCILILAAANFVFIVGMLLSRKGRRDFKARPTGLGVMLRAASLLYAVASLIVLLISSMLFYSYEVSDEAKEFWKNAYGWMNVKTGMTEQDVIRILGPPSLRGLDNAGVFMDKESDDAYIYQMRMLTIENRVVAFKIDQTSASKEMKVIDKYPNDETAFRYLSEWKPFYPISNGLTHMISDLALAISFVGIAVLALVSILPFGLRNGWNSWTLYTPFIALMLGAVYEMNIVGGWRFDLFLLFPAYLLIFGCWLFRLAKAVKLYRAA